jgi:hypothetical protein
MIRCIRRLCLVAALFAVAQTAHAETVVTPTFVIVIVRNCEMGFLGCQDVLFVRVNRNDGESISVKGSETYRSCRGTSDICEVTGYLFKSGDVVYEINRDNFLTVHDGKSVLVEEQGQLQ